MSLGKPIKSSRKPGAEVYGVAKQIVLPTELSGAKSNVSKIRDISSNGKFVLRVQMNQSNI